MRTRGALFSSSKPGGVPLFLAALFSLPVLPAYSQAVPPAASATAGTKAPVSPAKPVSVPSGRSQPPLIARRAALFYESVWGVDSLSVRAVESGELIRFTYHVLDPEKSKSLNDKKLEPSLNFPEGRVKLVIPSLEKVGQLRQSSTPEAGKSYWMAFSNPGRTVKRGDRVDVVIGSFRAEGLTVE